MKNKILQITKLIFFIINLFFISSLIYADEFEIEALKIEYDNKNEKLLATGDVVAKSNDGLIINAQEVIYNKKNNTLEAKKSVVIKDESSNSEIRGENILLDKEKEKILSFGKTFIYFKDNYNIVTSDIIFDRNKNTIRSNNLTSGLDKEGNKLTLDNFVYHIQNYNLRSQGKIQMIDTLNNNYFFKNIVVDVKNEKFAGSDVRVTFNKNTFDNDSNDPRLVANSAIVSKNKTIIQKGIFTTCKRNDEKCPPWQMGASQITHDKKKKTIYYKKAWLKIYDIPIMYFPKFFHPDPTVKRQSGFLMPSITNSSTIGTAINLPYYFALADHKDLTLKPKIYYNENSVIQTEYRHVTKRSKTILDASFNRGYKNTSSTKTDGSRNHFFLNSKINLDSEYFEESNAEINIQRTSNDTYLRVHNLQSELIKNNILLNSNLDFSFLKNDMSLDLDFNVYEDLNKTDNRYEYIAPNYDFKNKLLFSEKYGNFDFKSSGYYKNYNSNVKETFLINDFLWKSNNHISYNGFISNFEGNIKNLNYESTKSTSLKNDKTNIEFAPVLSLKTSYPLKKEDGEKREIFSPTFMLRYAPLPMNNLENDQLRLTTDNLFELNKINNETIENGATLAIGAEYNYYDKNLNLNKLESSFGQIYSFTDNTNMPTQSSLDQKTSDLVGKIKYNFTQNNSLSYNFSLDHNFNQTNYDEISTTFKVNNLVANFDYIEENNFIGDNNYLNAGLKIEIDPSNSLNFKTRKNYKTNVTEFYNLQYLYENDCLRAGIEFNKSFYSDKDLEPENTLLFTLTIIPFGKINTPSLYGL